MGVGSWVQAQTSRCAPPADCGAFADYWSEAIVYQIYLQHSPVALVPAWLRLGTGLANTSTLVPGRGVIGVSDRWRAALTGGIGADVRVSNHLFVTPSLDYTVLPAVDRRGRELRRALALGIGATIR
jgi:hypothetical protein